MSTDLLSIVSIAVLIWHGIEQSYLYILVTLFLRVYGIVVFVDVVFLLLLHDVRSNLQQQRFGGRRPLIQPAKFLKRWEAIKARLESGKPSYYQAAILEADALADEMLGEIGYEGGTVGERLGLIRSGQILSAERLQQAHLVRHKIIHDHDFSLSKEEAEELLSFYESFFKELELM